MNQPIKTKEMYQRDLNMSRMNLLLSVFFTVVNLVFMMNSITSSFFFSASIPYYPAFFLAFNCRIFKDSVYDTSFKDSEYADTWRETYQFLDSSIFWTVFVISVVMVVGLLLLWYFSKKHKVCSMITLSFYIVDTLFLVVFSLVTKAGGIGLILQLLFHFWIVYYAVLSVRAWKGIATAPTAAEVAKRSGYGTPRYGVNPYVAGSPYGRPYGGYGDDDEDEDEDEESESGSASEEDYEDSVEPDMEEDGESDSFDE